MNKIDEKINKIFKNAFKSHGELSTITRDLNEWDSLKHMDLVMSLEKEFQITFEVEEIIQINNINDCIKIINSILIDKNRTSL